MPQITFSCIFYSTILIACSMNLFCFYVLTLINSAIQIFYICNLSSNSTIKKLFFLRETDIRLKTVTKAMFDFLPFFVHRVFEFFFLKQLVSKLFPSFCRIMINCEDLVIADGQASGSSIVQRF